MSSLSNLTQYQAGAIIGVVAAAAPIAQFRALFPLLGGQRMIYVTRIEIATFSAVPTAVALRRASLPFGDPSTEVPGRLVSQILPGPNSFLPPQNSPNGRLVSAWTVAPGYQAVDLIERVSVMQNVGDKIVWEWSEAAPLAILQSTTMTIQNVSVGNSSGVFVSARWFELGQGV
jgi:hypothetical protein